MKYLIAYLILMSGFLLGWIARVRVERMNYETDWPVEWKCLHAFVKGRCIACGEAQETQENDSAQQSGSALLPDDPSQGRA